MADVFRRSRQLLHPAGGMVVMFDHKQMRAWRALGMALIRAGFHIRSSVPIHTEAESSLNIGGLDAARSTVLLLCQPHEESEQPVGIGARSSSGWPSWREVRRSVPEAGLVWDRPLPISLGSGAGRGGASVAGH